jgi:hypothetical protein
MGQAHLATAFPVQPAEPFGPRPKQGFFPVGTGELLAKSGRPTGGGGVAGEQAGGVTDQVGGRREGRSSPEGFSMAEGIGSGEEMATS